MLSMEYKVVNMESYRWKDMFRHFSQDCLCSCSITNKVDVTKLVAYSKNTGTKFYTNFLYLLSKVLNSRDDYKLAWQSDKLICYDKINPEHYVFHDDTETFTVVYTEFDYDYEKFYANASEDIERAKNTREYGLDMKNHPNWFNASYISWLSYESLNIELPNGYLYFMPIINWGRYSVDNDKFMLPLTVRMNHAIADGYLISLVFKKLEEEIIKFVIND